MSSNLFPTGLPTPATTPTFSSESPLTVLVSTRVVITNSAHELILTPATITISSVSGKIISVSPSILPPSSFPSNTKYIDHTPHLIIPGLVDSHVHLNEPGRTEWEGFWTGTRAAASGGVTTVIDMPLNAIPPTTTIQGLEEKVDAARGKCWVDVGFWGGIIPGNVHELLPLVEAGVRGFKGFLIESGVDEFPAVSSQDVALAMTTLKDSPTMLLFHAEMIPPIAASVGDDVQVSLPPMVPQGPLDSYDTFLASRPPVFETCAISSIISQASLAPNLQLHIVHLSAIEAIPLLQQAQANGVKISAETCFHYLTLASEDVPVGDTRHKCCPPIRSTVNRNGLWEELHRPNSVIQTIVSDHSPCTPALKLLPSHLASLTDPAPKDAGDFFSAWGGVSSVGLGLPILYTSALHSAPQTTILDVVRWCCRNTAIQVGLAHKKGSIAPGMDADICVFDDEGSFVLGHEQMLFRNKVSPYQGKTLRGVVKETYVRGRSVFTRDGGFRDEKPSGELILEKRGF